MSLIRRIKILIDDAGGVRKHREDWEKTGRSSRREMGLMGNAFGRFKGLIIGGLVSIGSALVAALSTKAAVAAAEFKKNFAQIDTLVDNTKVNIRKLEDDLREMARNSTEDINVLTKALYQLVSAGVDASKAVEVLDVAVRASAAGGTDVATAVDGITNAMNGFGLAAEDAMDIADIFFVGVRNGKTTFGELSGSIGQTAALASTLGADLDEVIAASAALTLTGKTTSETMTQLSSAFTSMIKNADEFKAVGIDVKKVLREEGFSALIQKIAEATNMNEEALAALFPRLEGLTGVMSLAGNQAAAFAKNLLDMENRAGSTATAFREVSDEASHTAGLIGSRLKSAMITLGEGILTVANPALSGLIRLMESFDTPAEAMVRRLKEMGAAAEDIRIAQLHKAIEQSKEELEELQSVTFSQFWEQLVSGDVNPLQGRFVALNPEEILQQRGVRRGVRPFIDVNAGGESVAAFGSRGVDTLRGSDVTDTQLEEALKFNLAEAVRLSKERGAANEHLVAELQKESELISTILMNRRLIKVEEDALARARAEQRVLLGQELEAGDLEVFNPALAPIDRKDVEAAEKEAAARRAVARKQEQERNAAEIEKAARRGEESAKRLNETLSDAMKIDAAPEELRTFVEEIVRAERELARAEEIRKAIVKGRGDTSDIDAVIQALTEQVVTAKLAEDGFKVLSEEFQSVRDEAKETASEFEYFAEVARNARFEEPGGINEQIEAFDRLTVSLENLAQKREDVETAKFSGDSEATAEAIIEQESAAADVQVIVADILDKWADKLPKSLRGPVLKAIRDIRDGTEEAKDEAEEYAEKMKKIGDTLDSVADAGRALLRMGDIFDFLSDKARDFAGAILDAVDNAGNLVTAIGKGDVLGGIVAGAGLLGSLGSAIGILGGDDGEEAERQRELHLERREAEREMREALRENARRIEDAIERLIEATLVGGDTTQETIEQGRKDAIDFLVRGSEQTQPNLPPDFVAAFRQLLEARSRLPNASDTERPHIEDAIRTLEPIVADWLRTLGLTEGQALDRLGEVRERGFSPEEFFEFLEDLIDQGAITEDMASAWRGAIEAMIAGGMKPGEISDAIGAIVRDELIPFFDDIGEQFGEFSRTVQGAGRRFNTLSSILGDSEIALKDFIKFITEIDPETGKSLIDPDSIAGKLLAEFATADEDRRNEILDEIGAIIQDPDRFAAFLPEGMTPNEFLALIAPLFGFRTPEEAGADDPAATFTDVLADAETAVRRLTQLLGEDLIFAFDDFIKELLKGSQHFDADLASILREAKGLDLTTDAGRERLGEIVRLLTADLMSGNTFGLEEDVFERLITDLNRFATADYNPQGFTRGVSIARTITEVQGNEVVILLSGIFQILQIISAYLTGEKWTPLKPDKRLPYDDRPLSGDPTVDDMPIHSVDDAEAPGANMPEPTSTEPILLMPDTPEASEAVVVAETPETFERVGVTETPEAPAAPETVRVVEAPEAPSIVLPEAPSPEVLTVEVPEAPKTAEAPRAQEAPRIPVEVPQVPEAPVPIEFRVEVPDLSGLEFAGADAPVVNATVVNNFDIDIKADTVDEMLRQLENRVRDKSYRAFPQRI